MLCIKQSETCESSFLCSLFGPSSSRDSWFMTGSPPNWSSRFQTHEFQNRKLSSEHCGGNAKGFCGSWDLQGLLRIQSSKSTIFRKCSAGVRLSVVQKWGDSDFGKKPCFLLCLSSRTVSKVCSSVYLHEGNMRQGPLEMANHFSWLLLVIDILRKNFSF